MKGICEKCENHRVFMRLAVEGKEKVIRYCGNPEIIMSTVMTDPFQLARKGKDVEVLECEHFRERSK